MKIVHTYPRGFTLIEAVVYLALFSILIGGAIVSSYSIFESMGRNWTKSVMQEEGNFLLGKINWVLSGTQSVDAPPAGSTDSTLSVTKWDPLIVNPITVALSGSDVTLKRGTDPSRVLNNVDVQVTNLQFVHEYPGGTNPEDVHSSFTLSVRTPNGMIVSQDFSSTNYLRR